MAVGSGARYVESLHENPREGANLARATLAGSKLDVNKFPGIGLTCGKGKLLINDESCDVVSSCARARDLHAPSLSGDGLDPLNKDNQIGPHIDGHVGNLQFKDVGH